MDKIQQQAIITLVKSALTGQTYSLPDCFDFAKAVSYAKKSQITGLLYCGMINCGISPDLPFMRQLFLTVCTAVAIDEQQLYEFSRITELFNKNNIKYMPMKGILLKTIYPKSNMRTMSDLDILIDETQYSRIVPLMEELGYQKGTESDHELPWRKDRIYVELHKRIISTHNKDFYSYFGDGWDFAHPLSAQPNRYEMTHEDVYIYLFTHLVKHYRSGGIGMKHMTDLWVYRNIYPNMDMKYVAAALKKMMLLDFYNNVMLTLSVWFEEAKPTEITDLISYVIFKSGAFGNYDDHLAALVIRDFKTENKRHNRIREISALFFPPYHKMCLKYQVLNKFPALLPFMWVYRGVSAFKNGFGKMKSIRKNVDVIAKDKVTLYHESLQKVGLDYNFEGHR